MKILSTLHDSQNLDDVLKVADGVIIGDAMYAKALTHDFKDRFAKANNKKTIWTIACELGAEYSSLSKFYNYFKSKDEYIENLISWSNLKKVIKNMGINDVVLNNLYEDAYIHKKPFDDEFNARAYRNAKGK